MAETDLPNRKSNMEKAEGDRPADADEPRGDAGITNRPLDEEVERRKRVPDRGETKPTRAARARD